MTELTHAQSVGLSWHGPKPGLIGVQFAQSLLHPEEELEEEELEEEELVQTGELGFV